MNNFKQSMPKLVGLMLGIVVLLGIFGLSSLADNNSEVQSQESTISAISTSGAETSSAIEEVSAISENSSSTEATSEEASTVSSDASSEEVSSKASSDEGSSETSSAIPSIQGRAAALTKEQFIRSIQTYAFSIENSSAGNYSGQTHDASLMFAFVASETENLTYTKGSILFRIEMPSYSVFSLQQTSDFAMGTSFADLESTYKSLSGESTVPFTTSSAVFQGTDSGKNYVYGINYRDIAVGNMMEAGFKLVPAKNGETGNNADSLFHTDLFYGDSKITQSEIDAVEAQDKVEHPDLPARTFSFDWTFRSLAKSYGASAGATNVSSANIAANVADPLFPTFYVDFALVPTSTTSNGLLYDGSYYAEQIFTTPARADGSLKLLFKESDISVAAIDETGSNTAVKITNVVTESGTGYVKSFKVEMTKTNVSNPLVQMKTMSARVTFQNVKGSIATSEVGTNWSTSWTFGSAASGFSTKVNSIVPEVGAPLAEYAANITATRSITFSIAPKPAQNLSENIAVAFQSVYNGGLNLGNTVIANGQITTKYYGFENKQGFMMDEVSLKYEWTNEKVVPSTFTSGKLSWTGGSEKEVETKIIAVTKTGTEVSLSSAKTAVGATSTAGALTNFALTSSTLEASDIAYILVVYKNVPAGAKMNDISYITFDVPDNGKGTDNYTTSISLNYSYKDASVSAAPITGSKSSSYTIVYNGSPLDNNSVTPGSNKGSNKASKNVTTGGVGNTALGDVMYYEITLSNTSTRNWYNAYAIDSFAKAYLTPQPASQSGNFLANAKIVSSTASSVTLKNVSLDGSGNLKLETTGVIAPGQKVVIGYYLDTTTDPKGAVINNTFEGYAWLSDPNGTSSSTGGGTGQGGPQKVTGGFWTGNSSSGPVAKPIVMNIVGSNYKHESGDASAAASLSNGDTFTVTGSIAGNRPGNIGLTVNAFAQNAPAGYKVTKISYFTTTSTGDSATQVVPSSSWITNTTTMSNNLTLVNTSVNISDFKINTNADKVTFIYEYKVVSDEYSWDATNVGSSSSMPINVLAYFKETDSISLTRATTSISTNGPFANNSTAAPFYYTNNAASKQIAGVYFNVTIVKDGARGNISAGINPNNTTNRATPVNVTATIGSIGNAPLEMESIVFNLPPSIDFTSIFSTTGLKKKVVGTDGSVSYQGVTKEDLEATIIRTKEKNPSNGALIVQTQIVEITSKDGSPLVVPAKTGTTAVYGNVVITTTIDSSYLDLQIFDDPTLAGKAESGRVGYFLTNSADFVLDSGAGNGTQAQDSSDLNQNGNTTESIISKDFSITRSSYVTGPKVQITPQTVQYNASAGSETWANYAVTDFVSPGNYLGWKIDVINQNASLALVNPTLVLKYPSNLEISTDADGYKAGTTLSTLGTPVVKQKDNYTYVTYQLNTTLNNNGVFTFSTRTKSLVGVYGTTLVEAYLIPSESNPFLDSTANSKGANPLWKKPSTELAWDTDTTVGGNTYSTSVNPYNGNTHMVYGKNSMNVYGYTGANTSLSQSVGSQSSSSTQGEVVLYTSNKDAVVQYSLNVKNEGTQAFEDVMLIDRLPVANDRYTVSADANRGSNTGVTLYNNGEFVVTEDGRALTEGTDYVIEYATLPLNYGFTNSDWTPGDNATGVWSTTPSATTNVFRVYFLEPPSRTASGSNILGGSKIEVTFKTKWDANVVEEGALIYNSFGLSATAVKMSGTIPTPIPFKLEPYKQGVTLLANGQVIINKTLMDSSQTPANTSFAFEATATNASGESTSGTGTVDVTKMGDATYVGQGRIEKLYLPDGTTKDQMVLEETTQGYESEIELSKYEELNGQQIWTYEVVNKTNYTVTYDGNGATGGIVPVDPAEYPHGTSATVLTGTPERTGAIFLGWTENADGTGTILNAGDQVTVNGNVILHAKWDFIDYQVTFEANARTGATMTGAVNSPLTQNYQDVVNVPAPTMQIPGATFVEWNTAADGSGTSYAPSATFPMPANDVALYAIWEYSGFSLEYNANTTKTGNLSGSMAIEPYELADTVTVKPSGFTLTGATFLGWSTSSTATVPDPAYAPGSTFFMPSSNVVLYAVWDYDEFTVTYSANVTDTSRIVGTVNATETHLYSDSVTVATPSFTVKGADFTGWNTAADGTGTSYAAGAIFSMPLANVTLYAQYTAHEYTITYNGNGYSSGVIPTDNTKYHYGDTPATALKGSLVKTGYEFTGWNTAADGSGVSYAAGANVNPMDSSISLYAQWYRNLRTIKVSYDANGGKFTDGTTTKTDPNLYEPGEVITIRPASDLTPRANYTFIGWSSNRAGTIMYTPNSQHTLTGNLTLYAIWEVDISIKVVYHLVDNANPVINASSNIVQTVPFNEYFTIYDGTGLKMSNGEGVYSWSDIQNARYFFNEKKIFSAEGLPLVKESENVYVLDLYPSPEKKKSTVTYTINASSVINDYTEAPIRLGAGDTVPFPDLRSVTKDNMIFVGWKYTDPATGKVVTANIKEDGTFDQTLIMGTQDIKLTAVFSLNKAKIR